MVKGCARWCKTWYYKSSAAANTAQYRTAGWARSRARCSARWAVRLQEALSSYGAWYLVIVGGLAVIATLVSPRGLWGFAADRFGWSLLPGASAARMTANRPLG